MMSELLTNGVTIFIALLAALIAIYQVKSNIISSARINWIEKLREAASELFNEYSNCQACHANIEYKTNKLSITTEELWRDYQELRTIENRITVLSRKINLYLDPENAKQKKVIEKLDKIEDLLSMSKNKNIQSKDTQTEILEIIEEATKLFREVFKDEWNKSRKIFKH